MNNTKLSYVQVSRAVAILFVLLGHVNTEFYKAYGYEWFNMGEWDRTGGVDFFFIVTGFMIYYLYHKQVGMPGKASEFLLKRAIRILPLYWIFTLILVIAAPLIKDFGVSYSWGEIVKSFLFLENAPVIGSTWSLKHILFFYLLFAALIYNPKRFKPIIVIWVIFTILTELNLAPFFESFLFSFSSLEVLMGSLVAYYILHYKVKYSTVWVILGFTGFLFVWINNVLFLYEIHAPFFYCLFSMFIMLGIAEKDRRPRKVPKMLSFLGDASYSIYIAHGPLLILFIRVLEAVIPTDMRIGNLMMVLVILLTTISCCFVYVFIEKPLTSVLRRRMFSKKEKLIVAKTTKPEVQVDDTLFEVPTQPNYNLKQNV
jgi:exopolysaccharide production protein ExoZ